MLSRVLGFVAAPSDEPVVAAGDAWEVLLLVDEEVDIAETVYDVEDSVIAAGSEVDGVVEIDEVDGIVDFDEVDSEVDDAEMDSVVDDANFDLGTDTTSDGVLVGIRRMLEVGVVSTASPHSPLPQFDG